MTNSNESRSKIYLEEKVLNELTVQVRETLASEALQKKEKSKISAAEVWSIQKRKKEVHIRRNSIWN
jgi:hypothetical protein